MIDIHNEDKEWTDFLKKYSHEYDERNYSSPLQTKVMQPSHKLAERAFTSTDKFERVLEVGAGTGEHLHFVNHNFSEYVVTDMNQAAIDVAKAKAPQQDGRFKFDVQVGENLSYADGSFDRVVAVHVLEHIYKPHLAIKEWRRVLKDGGMLSILIPTDPGFAWRLGRNLGPRKNAIKQGLAYDYIMARDHVNSCVGLLALMRHYFPESKEYWWPFPVKSVDLNLFVAIQAKV